MAVAHQVFHFGSFVFDERRGEIRCDGESVAIHATPLRLLAYLIVHRDRTVAKEELLQRVWPDAFVGENALTSAMCELRRALKVDGTSQGLIRTERGRGYRLIAEVETRAASSSNAALTKVAVLPFADMSPGGDQAHLADGLTEELIHALSQVGGLQVVSRTSSFAFKLRHDDARRIGSALGVGTLVEGSVRTAGKRARVTAQVIRVEDGFHFWSQTFDHRIDNVLALETEIAREIRSAVERTLVESRDELVA